MRRAFMISLNHWTKTGTTLNWLLDWLRESMALLFHLLLFHILKLLPTYNKGWGVLLKTTKSIIRIWNAANLKIWKKLLVSSHCHNKIPQTRWLKKQKFVSYTSRASGIQDQGADRFGFWWELTSWFADVRLLTVH